LVRRLGGHQSRSGRGVEEKNSQPPPGIEQRRSSGDQSPILPSVYIKIIEKCRTLGTEHLEPEFEQCNSRDFGCPATLG